MMALVLVVVTVGLRIGMPICRQYVVIQAIRQLGGDVHVRMNSPAWLRDWLPDGFREPLAVVSMVDLGTPAVTDADVWMLQAFPDIEGLSLSSSQVTDAGIAQLIALERLEVLLICSTRVTDAGLEHLKELRHLRHLNVIGSNVTQEGIDRLRKSVPHLVVKGRRRDLPLLDIDE